MIDLEVAPTEAELLRDDLARLIETGVRPPGRRRRPPVERLDRQASAESRRRAAEDRIAAARDRTPPCPKAVPQGGCCGTVS